MLRRKSESESAFGLLQRIQSLLLTLFNLLGEHWKALNVGSSSVIDTFPISGCDTIRISRAKMYRGEVYRGYQASKRRYVYGI